MHVWPAIDLCNGKCVRLIQGDFERSTVYADEPLAVAKRWKSEGAQRLHLVDLDGAKSGTPEHLSQVECIANSLDIICQFGGGIRHADTLHQVLSLGIHRVVLGTKAAEPSDWLLRAIADHPGRIVIGLDCRDGRVATDGWLREGADSAEAVAARYEAVPIAGFIYTDIRTDGMLSGPNLEALRVLREHTCHPLIASGGIASLDDIERVAELGVEGVIIGRALYEGTIHLPEALKAAHDTRWNR